MASPSFSQSPVPVATHLDNPLGVELLGNQLLVAERNKNQIALFDLDSGSTLKVDSITGFSLPHDLVVANGELYVAQTNSIVKVDLSVSPPAISTVATSMHSIIGLTHYGKFLYFVEWNTNPVFLGNQISKLNFDSYEKSAVTGWASLLDIKYAGIAIDQEQLYVADFLRAVSSVGATVYPQHKFIEIDPLDFRFSPFVKAVSLDRGH